MWEFPYMQSASFGHVEVEPSLASDVLPPYIPKSNYKL